jgi:hypothetical protein
MSLVGLIVAVLVVARTIKHQLLTPETASVGSPLLAKLLIQESGILPRCNLLAQNAGVGVGSRSGVAVMVMVTAMLGVTFTSAAKAGEGENGETGGSARHVGLIPAVVTLRAVVSFVALVPPVPVVCRIRGHAIEPRIERRLPSTVTPPAVSAKFPSCSAA